MIRVYTDGACGTTGEKIGGWAWILTEDEKHVAGDMGRAHQTTNQRMELVAACEALEWLPAHIPVTVVSDSAYLINGMTQSWYVKWRANGWVNSAKKPVENRYLWERLLAAVEGRVAVTGWEHVKGHDGNHWNERCDVLAVHARTS